MDAEADSAAEAAGVSTPGLRRQAQGLSRVPVEGLSCGVKGLLLGGVEEVEDAPGHGGPVREEWSQVRLGLGGAVLVGNRRDGVEDRRGDGVRPSRLVD